MILRHIILVASALLIDCKSLSRNDSAVLITKYAKVAHWGASASSSTTQKTQSEGRSNNGQTLWAHRADANIISSQNLKPGVVYQYPTQRKPSNKIGEVKAEVLPAVGEVQERFNPRPYFDYESSPPKSSNMKSGSKSQATMPPSFDSFPVFSNPPSDPPSPSVDPYTSSYSSYNPPSNLPNSAPQIADVSYPPNGPPPDKNPSEADDFKGYTYDHPKNVDPHLDEPPKSPYPSLGPPLAPHDDHHHHDSHHNSHHNPHKHEDQVYYPPDDDMHHEVILDHPPPGYEEQKPAMMNGMGMDGMKAMPNMAPLSPQDYDEPKPDMADVPQPNHDMAEQDLSPPVPDNYEAKFPQYLYNDPHQQNNHDFGTFYDHHHVYKEVATTTTTEAPEDERVNKGHYSYYYLGRKLWYIPLYFSVYFVIYVTVLILKSIARHKINLKHDFHYNRKAKEMDLDRIDDAHRNVTAAIETTRKRFNYIAM